MLQIGNIHLNETPLLLAPMEDITDPSFRAICKHYGADLLYTEFVASESLIRNIDKAFQKLRINEHERPVAIQIYGHNIDAMAEAARIVTQANPDFIDINYGCPVRKIAMRGAGSGMMRDVDKMVRMTDAIVKATHLPVTVKTRLGWDDDSKNIEEIALKLQDVGIKALTIHGRTREQLYKGRADWTLIGKIKADPRMKIPIIGNGDIDSPQTAKNMLDKYGVDALMIGRAAIGKPWIFREVKHFLKTGQILPPPTLAEKVDLAKKHFTESLKWKAYPKGMLEMRRHFATYFKGLPDFKPLRYKLLTENQPENVLLLLDELLQQYAYLDERSNEL